MIKNLKQKLKALCFAMILTFGALFGTISFSVVKHAGAESVSQGAYYYNQLNSIEKKFYNAIRTNHASGVLRRGGVYNLTSAGVVSADKVKDYATGNQELLIAFENAKDAYMFEHPELFYINFDKLTLSFYEKSGQYVAYLDQGNNKDYFADGINYLTVDSKLETFDGENGYQKFLPQNADLSTFEKIEYVSNAMVGSIDFLWQGTKSSAYDAVLGSANSKGYANLFKLCMDSLGIECLTVYGYVVDDLGNWCEHAFNYVKFNGRWLVVDVFMNDVTASNDYLLAQKEMVKDTHIISNKQNSIKEFKVPELESFEIEKNYTKENLYAKVKYNGKSASRLLFEDDLYIVKIVKTGSAITYKALYDDVIIDSNIVVDNYADYVKFAVTAKAPDDNMFYTSLDESEIICEKVVENDISELADITRPVAIASAESLTTEYYVNLSEDKLPANGKFKISLTFDANLKQTDDIEILVESNGIDVSQSVVIENIQWSNQNAKVISFDFVPSKNHKHQVNGYSFDVLGLVSADSNVDMIPRTTHVSSEVDDVKFHSISNQQIFEYESDSPYFEAVNINELSLKYKNDTSVANAEKQNLMLASTIVTGGADGNGEVQELYNVNLFANSKEVVLDNSCVQIVFPFIKGKSYDILKTKNIIVSRYDENLQNETVCDFVLTEYGIVVSVSNSGIFKIAYDESEKSQDKMIYIKALDSLGISSTSVKNKIFKFSQAIVSIDLISKNNHEIDFVIFDGADVTKKITDNKITIRNDDVNNYGVLKVRYISSDRKQQLENEKATRLEKQFIKNQQITFEKDKQENEDGKKPMSKTTILLIIIGSWVVLCVAVVVVIVCLKKKGLKLNENEKQEN